MLFVDYPGHLIAAVLLILSVAAVFVVVLNVYRRPTQIKRLLKAISLIGGAIAVLGLAQYIFGNGKVYWFVSAQHSGFVGTFLNHNHYSQN